MALFHGNELISPRSISSSNRAGLERKMLMQNLKDRSEHKYISIYYDPEKKEHIAWYYVLTNEKEIIKGVINDNDTKK